MNIKHYLVVGGSHGIGFGITERLIAQGMAVTVVSRTHGSLETIQSPHLKHVIADITTEELDGLPLPDSLDGMAYCPGSINLAPLRLLKLEQMRSDFELNVVGAVRVMQRVLPSLKSVDQSSVVMFGTVAVERGIGMHTSVSAAKGAVESITRCWAAELAPKIRVNCIAPALTDTPLSKSFLSNEAKRNAMSSMYPLGRIGTVDDIASMATFLLSPQSGWITGQVIGIDGGLSRLQSASGGGR